RQPRAASVSHRRTCAQPSRPPNPNRCPLRHAGTMVWGPCDRALPGSVGEPGMVARCGSLSFAVPRATIASDDRHGGSIVGQSLGGSEASLARDALETDSVYASPRASA